MSRHDVGDSLLDVQDEFAFELDMQIAARSRVPVLISGSPRCALLLTQSIAGRLSRADRSIRIVTCDLADSGELATAFGAAPSSAQGRPSRPSIILLREVHALTQSGQAMLLGLLRDRQAGAPRVFASSSVSLYDRMTAGLFDEHLFYQLNMIHIVTSEMPAN